MVDYALGELFAGPGGIAVGAREASRISKKDRNGSTIHHAWALDNHPDTTATYRHNIVGADESTVVTADVRDYDLREAPIFDALAFGFPCNDFSAIGERRGLNGEFGPLYIYGVHALALRGPDWFIAENVSGLSKSDGGRAFGRILRSLKHPGRAALTDDPFRNKYHDRLRSIDEDLEYDLVAHLYRFEEYDVPQKRHRIIVTGIRRDIVSSTGRRFRVPVPTSSIPRKQKTVRDVLETRKLPFWVTNNELPKHAPHVIERLNQIDPGKNAFNTSFTDDIPGIRLNVKGATLSNIYKRVHPDRPSYTVTGSGGGGTHMYHWKEPRALTNRERARLQTFPDDHEFLGGRQSIRRQIGMAVPPDGAKVIIDAMLKTLDGFDYKGLEKSNIGSDALIEIYEQGLHDAGRDQPLDGFAS